MFDARFENTEKELSAEFTEMVEGSGGRYVFGDGLKYAPDTRTLSVDVAERIEEGDMRPISSDALYQEFSALEQMLKDI